MVKASYSITLVRVNDGATGVGVKSVTNYYLATASGSGVTTGTSGWTTTVQSVSASKKYLWNYEKVTFTNNTTSSTDPCIIGAYGDKGATGGTGATGNGIASITEYYQISTSNSTVPTTWVTTVPTLTATNKYLWNYEKITYTNNSTSETAKRVIGVYGDKGQTGNTGAPGTSVTVSSTSVTYQASSSGTTTPTGTWSSSVPTVNNGQYLWTKTVVNFSDGKSVTSYSVSYKGTNGATGPAGQNGVSIGSVINYYLATASSSGVTTSTSGWTTTIQSVTATKKYLWNYEVVKSTAGATISTSSPCIIGVYGDKGQTGNTGATGPTGPTGNGVSSIVEYYALSTSTTAPANSSFSTTIPTLTATNRYLWNYEVINYTTGSPTTTAKKIIGVYGDKGNTGATGVGIKSVTNYYLATASGSGVTTGTSGWTTTIQNVSSSKKYLWNYEKITYTDNTTSSTDPCIIGAYGDTGNTGATGATGNGISSIAEHYQVSTSNSTAPTSWLTTVPAMTATNKYLWNYETITYTNGTTKDTLKRVIGVYGDKGNTGSQGPTGPTGPTGVGVKSVTNYYLASASSSGVTTGTSGWTTTVQNVSASKKYLWNYEVVTFTNNSTSYTSPCIIGAYGDKGQTGNTGATGNGISSITEYYQVSSSNSTAPTSWLTTVPAMTATNKYLWNYEKITYTSGSTSETLKRVIGVYGDKGNTGSQGPTGPTGPAGSNGVGISTVTEYYALSTSNSTAPTSGWSTTPPAMTATNRYLWNYEVIKKTDNSTISTAKRVIGVYGDKGNTGATGGTGATGNGISSITNYYLVSSSSSGITTSTSGWSTTPGTTTTTNKYLWNYEKITYTNSNVVNTTPRIIGTHGATGSQGPTGPAGSNGVGITKTEVFYYLSTSNTTQSGGSWATTVPAWVDGRYYWQKIKTTFTNGTSSESTPVCITGAKGSTGSQGPTGPTGGTGATGTGVQSITVEFYLSTSKTSQSGGSWTTTMPTWSSGKYLWTQNKIVYKNPASTVYTTPICDSSWEAVNEIQVGGRNILLNSSMHDNTNLWCSTTPTIVEYKGRKCAKYEGAIGSTKCLKQNVLGKLEPNTQYTMSGWVMTENIVKGTTNFCIRFCQKGNYDNAGTSTWYGYGYKSFTVNAGSGEWEYLVWTFTTDAKLNNTTESYMYVYTRDFTGQVYFCDLKLEKGNKATDWTPAPEDVDNKIDENTNEIYTTITDQKTEITNNCEAIILDALATYVKTSDYDEFKQTVESELAVMADEIQMSFTTVTEHTNAVDDDMQTKFTELYSYISFTSDGIQLGKSDSAITLSIENDIISFKKNGEQFGWWDGVDFHTGNIVVDLNERAQFGNFAFVPRSDGSLSFLKVGG